MFEKKKKVEFPNAWRDNCLSYENLIFQNILFPSQFFNFSHTKVSFFARVLRNEKNPSCKFGSSRGECPRERKEPIKPIPFSRWKKNPSHVSRERVRLTISYDPSAQRASRIIGFNQTRDFCFVAARNFVKAISLNERKTVLQLSTVSTSFTTMRTRVILLVFTRHRCGCCCCLCEIDEKSVVGGRLLFICCSSIVYWCR